MSEWCDVCRFETPGHAPWCPVDRPSMKPDENALREMANRMAEERQMKQQQIVKSDAISNFQRITDLEAENKRLREALREIMETDSEPLSHRIARKALGDE